MTINGQNRLSILEASEILLISDQAESPSRYETDHRAHQKTDIGHDHNLLVGEVGPGWAPRRRAVLTNAPTPHKAADSLPKSSICGLVLMLAVSLVATYLLWAKITGSWPFPPY